MSRLVFLLLIGGAPLAGRVQAIPDTTDAWSYYPLAVGDVWEYHIIPLPPDPPREERWAIVADTLVGDTVYSVQVRSWWSADEGDWAERERLLLRYDTLTTRVMRRTEAGEWPEACNLGAPFGAAVDCLPYPGADGEPEDQDVQGQYGGAVDIGGQVVAVEAKKRFISRMQAWPDVFPEYAAPIGYVRGYGAFCVLCDERLLYARVGGVEYGTPVSAEPGPEYLENPLSLMITPNPVRSGTEIRLTLPTPALANVAVHDALGRRVILLHHGPLPAGVSTLVLDAEALPQGAYNVRATAGMHSATARVVVQ